MRDPWAPFIFLIKAVYFYDMGQTFSLRGKFVFFFLHGRTGGGHVAAAAVMVSCAVLFAACVSFPGSFKVSKIPISYAGEYSTVTLALVKRQNLIHDGERIYEHEDGLAFYFVVEPAAASGSVHPAIREAQNFTIDGVSYWRNKPGSIDSLTVIYNTRTFAEHDPGAALEISAVLDSNPEAFIQKTVICGEKLPSAGIVRYPFYFGFEQELEEFEFLFRLQDTI
jgi:hypothetical protein